MRGTRSSISSSSQVIILREGKHTIGLLVDELHAVPQFKASQIMHTPLAISDESMLVTLVIQANDGQLLIQAIDVARLFSLVIDGQIALPPQTVCAQAQEHADKQTISLLAA